MAQPALARRLGVVDAVVVGLSAMVGAGVFSAFSPAAAAAGGLLPASLLVAGVVAWCNATSSARLAVRYPCAGGTYVYGRERLGPFWGHLAGWSFVVGKTASCAAMAMTVGAYLWPEHARAVAVATVVALTALSCLGVQRTAVVARVLVAVALVALAVTVAVCLPHASTNPTSGSVDGGLPGLLQAAGLLFFAFAGYARIATLAEEVTDPGRTIPQAVTVALGIVLVLYALVGGALVRALGVAGLATSSAPVADAVQAAGATWLVGPVRWAAAAAATGSLLALVLGVSRTALAMARDGRLPSALTVVGHHGVPWVAEVVVGAVVAVLVATMDLRGAIGFSSFGVLVYYAVANASAATLRPDEGPPPRWVPVVGLLGCVLLASALPPRCVLAGAGVAGLGAVAFLVPRRRTGPVPGRGAPSAVEQQLDQGHQADDDDQEPQRRR